MAQKIIGAQRDFSYGEVDVTLKRADEHPARKAGLRQMSNLRILNSGALQDRPGRRALYPVTDNGVRTERFTITSGNVFDIQFAAGRVKIINSAGSAVANFTLQGNGAALPWASTSDIQSIVYTVFKLTIAICFGHSMRPQVITWDGISTWSIADYTELVSGSQKRTPFYRLSPQGIQILPSARTGIITVVASTDVFKPAHVGTRIRFVNRQILITGYTNAQTVAGIAEESLPGAQSLAFTVDPSSTYSIGDVVIGSSTGSSGIVAAIDAPGKTISLQLLSNSSTQVIFGGQQISLAFTTADTVAGPAGSLQVSSAGSVQNPISCAVWDDEVMNDFRGYPASCFNDQFRVGFCDFPSIPGGISWSAINSPTDLYVVGATVPSGAMFEIAPDKVRVFYVVPGPEGSEFVFCDRKIYYIKIDASNPLVPGSVRFATLSGDGSGQVQPRVSQEVILYVNAGRNSMMAIVASGAYYRPFNTKGLSDFHAHLFNNITAIAVPTADGTFNERYAYVLNGDQSLVVGKYNLSDISSDAVKVGWGPWSGVGTIDWVCAMAADVVFTTAYFGATICEIVDDAQYLDAGLLVNALPAAFAAPAGHGPLWWIPSQTVSLIDQSTRSMGTYQIDASGFIVAQGNGGENLAASTLVAGQQWTATAEPFAPDASPGQDSGQRMKQRQISYIAAYVVHSTGFVMGHLFSGRITRTSPALGTLMNQRRFPAWMEDDDPTLPPPQRETAELYPPQGSSFDPRAVIFKDTPGPLQILELAIEVSI